MRVCNEVNNVISGDSILYTQSLNNNASRDWQQQAANKTRKLSYRKDDRAMRPMYGMGALKIFGSP